MIKDLEDSRINAEMAWRTDQVRLRNIYWPIIEGYETVNPSHISQRMKWEFEDLHRLYQEKESENDKVMKLGRRYCHWNTTQLKKILTKMEALVVYFKLLP